MNHKHTHAARAATSNLRLAALLLGLPLLLQACGGENGTQASADDGSSKLSLAGTADKSGGGRGRLRNKPPSISGTSVTQTLTGLVYVFAPSASDPNGDPLVFSIANKPAWASFDTATGILSGTPTSADLGTTSGVAISVSDGRLIASLAPFDLAVVDPAPVPPPPPPPPTTNQASVTWAAPTTNVDGSALTDLTGYKLYYGQNAGALDRVVQVSGASTTSQVVDQLTSGTWYFAVSALNSAGLESALSALASRSYP